jgi:hypothetical protein
MQANTLAALSALSQDELQGVLGVHESRRLHRFFNADMHHVEM